MRRTVRKTPRTKKLHQAIRPVLRQSPLWWLTAGLLLFSLLVGVLAGVLGYTALHTPAVPTEPVAAHFSITYANGQNAQQLPATLTFVAPTALRTQITNDTLCGPPTTVALAEGTSQLLDCLDLSFANMLAAGRSLTNDNVMTLWDTNAWLMHDEDLSSDFFPPFGLVTSSQKWAAWNTLNTLSPKTALSAAVVNKLPKFVSTASYIAGPDRITYVQSADGKLHGIALIAIIAQRQTYDPTAYFEMAGILDTHPMLLQGHFKVSDSLENRINSLTSSDGETAVQLTDTGIQKFKADQVSPETLYGFGQVLALLRSIRLSNQ